MRFVVIVALSIALGTVAIAGSVRIHGIRVYGRLQDVSRADIREAIEANGPIEKPREVEVVSSNEMHAYYKSHELGWTPVRKLKYKEPVGNKAFAWSPIGLSVYEPAVLRAIRSADEVYVFPVVTPLEPHCDDKRLRLLGEDARRQIVGLLGKEQNWWHGAYHIYVGPHPPSDVGLLFRNRKNKVVLFFIDDLVEGTLDGQNIGGEFEFRGNNKEKLLHWKHMHADKELVAR